MLIILQVNYVQEQYGSIATMPSMPHLHSVASSNQVLDAKWAPTLLITTQK